MLKALWAAAVHWAFARLYHECAWTYDAVAWVVSRGYWRRWVLAALGWLGPGPVLELGCGTGNLQRALAESGRLHLGLDASPQMLTISSARLARADRPLRLVRALSQMLPLASGRVSNVVATFPSEYILHPATLAEIRRVLAPGGRLLIVAAARLQHDGLYERLIDLAYRLTLQGSVREEMPDDQERLGFLQQAGFVVRATWEPVDASQVLVVIADAPND